MRIVNIFTLIFNHKENILSEVILTLLWFPSKSLETAEFIIHPRYSPTTGQNDIALIKLPRPIAYSSNISPVCLPYKQEFQPGTDCFIAGWGAQDESHKRGVVSSQLMEARVPLLSGEGKGLSSKFY